MIVHTINILWIIILGACAAIAVSVAYVVVRVIFFCEYKQNKNKKQLIENGQL